MFLIVTSRLRIVAYNKMNLSRLNKTLTDCRRKHNVSVKKGEQNDQQKHTSFLYLYSYYHSHFGTLLYHNIFRLLLLLLLIFCQMRAHIKRAAGGE